MSGREAARILVAEDNDALRRGVVRALAETYRDVREAASGTQALAALREPQAQPYDVVVTDLRLPGADGLAVLRAARERDPATRVLLMTAYGSVETAVEAMREGASDFVQKPLDLERIEHRVSCCVEERRRQGGGPEPSAPRGPDAAPAIVGESAALRAAVDLARRVAPTRSTVLVTGETGTGKELVAGLIHRSSPRQGGPFVKVNCAALPETLLESELFGHERGSFTGADRQRIGRFEQASGGTLFLDEVGDMSPAIQAKLLRVLQEQEFHRLGGTEILRTDARIVAATNRDLAASVRAGAFREDLYFRLDVIRIHLPPLRERPDDCAALARHFLRQSAEALGRPVGAFSDAALARIRAGRWPGNARELANAIERAVLLADGPRVEAADLDLRGGQPEGDAGWCPELPAAGICLRSVERELVLAALRRADWVQKDAAELLGVSRRKLNYMIRRMGIRHPAWRRNRGLPPGGSAGEESPPRCP